MSTFFFSQVSNFSDTEDEDEDEDEVYDEEKYRKSLLQRDSSLSVENKTAENDDESDYDDDMYAQHHSKKYTENESMLNNNKSSNNNTTNKNNNDGKTKLKSRFCAFCNIKVRICYSYLLALANKLKISIKALSYLSYFYTNTFNQPTTSLTPTNYSVLMISAFTFPHAHAQISLFFPCSFQPLSTPTATPPSKAL